MNAISLYTAARPKGKHHPAHRPKHSPPSDGSGTSRTPKAPKSKTSRS